MAANGSEPFLESSTRVRKIQQIAMFLAQIEGKDPQDQSLHTLAQKFEKQIFDAALDVDDYNSRISKKLSKVQKVRQQQAAAQAAAVNQQQDPAQQLDPIDQQRLQQQQQQQQHQQAVSGGMLQGLHSSTGTLPTVSSPAAGGPSTPGAAAAAAAAAATAAWPNQYASTDTVVSSVGGAPSGGVSAGVGGVGGVGGRGGQGPGGAGGAGAYPGHVGGAWAGAGRGGGQGVDAAAQAVANVVASAAMGIPRQGSSLGVSSQGMVGAGGGVGVPSAAGLGMPSQGHSGAGTPLQHEATQEERDKQQRSLRAEELRNIYQEDIHYFVQIGSSLLKKLHKTRPGSQNVEQVLKLTQYVKEGHKALLYINRCHDTGHVPSAASLHSLESTLIRVHKASSALQVMIRDHSKTKNQPLYI